MPKSLDEASPGLDGWHHAKESIRKSPAAIGASKEPQSENRVITEDA